MKIAHSLLFFLAFIFVQTTCFAGSKRVSITIDDLPFVGEYRNFHLKMIMDALKKQQVPATGFIIAREVRKDNWEMLQQFREEGFGLGNHTFSHANLNSMSAEDYIEDLRKADTLLKPVLTQPKYFRFPYLAMGMGKKKKRVLAYLNKKHYHIAPITIDSKDFVFNQRLLSIPELNRRSYLAELKPFYLEFIEQQTKLAEEKTKNQVQIVLIHANLLNAYVLPDIIQLYKNRGYTFISLEDALESIKNYDPKSHPKENLTMSDASIESFMEWD
ncbi:MAG: polysaccharide deacetylase family protein [Legionella sp.]|nr:polysaccharide deacetylase family protein [Legionella sp.]